MDVLPPLWVAMEARRKALGLRAEALHHPTTRSKIKSGKHVRSDVTDALDKDLHWMPGDAERVQAQGIPPRPLEGSPDATAEVRGRRLTIVGAWNRVAMILADSPDDVPEDVLKDAERKAQEILDRLRGAGGGGGAKSSKG